MTTRIQDLDNKAMLYGKLFDQAETVHKDKDRESAVDSLATFQRILAVHPLMHNDAFFQALTKYRDDTDVVIANFRTHYRAFQEYANKAKQSKAPRVTTEDVTNAIDTCAKLTALFRDAGTHSIQDPMSTARYGGDSEQHGGDRSEQHGGEQHGGEQHGGFGNYYSPFVGNHGYNQNHNHNQSISYGRKLLEYMSRLHKHAKAPLTHLSNGTAGVDLIKALVAWQERVEASYNNRNQRYSMDSVNNTSTLDAIDDMLKVTLEYLQTHAPAFDGRKSSAADFITYSASPPDWWSSSGLTAITDQDNPYRTVISTDAVYSRLASPLMQTIAPAAKDVEKVVREAKNEPQANDAQALLTELSKLSHALQSMSSFGKKPAEIASLNKLILTKPSVVAAGAKLAFANKGVAYSPGMGVSPGEGAATSTVDGFMYRTLDKHRLRTYLFQLQSFEKVVSDDRVTRNVINLKTLLEARHQELDAKYASGKANADPLAAHDLKRSVRNAKLMSYHDYGKQVRRAVTQVVAQHTTFMLHRHRDAIAYVNYWDNMKDADIVVDEVAREDIDTYKDTVKLIVTQARKLITEEVRNSVRQAFKTTDEKKGESGVLLDNMQEEEVQQVATELMLWLGEQGDYVGDLYMHGNTGTLDMVLDPRFVTIYGLKLIRVFSAWYALRVAGALFQKMYDDKVYARDDDPPSTLKFIGMFMAIDLAINAVIGTVLLLVTHVFKSIDNTFPVDAAMIMAWGFDYVTSTAIIAGMAVVIGQVIEKKKYFRYKYEGDRGVRAMQQMVMYVYGIMLFVPFFRLMSG
jgi:hypothetical protein